MSTTTTFIQTVHGLSFPNVAELVTTRESKNGSDENDPNRQVSKSDLNNDNGDRSSENTT